MRFSHDDLDELLRLVDLTRAEEIDCTEFLHRVAGYVERLGGQELEVPPGYEDVAHHLRVCPECTEELDALCRALQGGD